MKERNRPLMNAVVKGKDLKILKFVGALVPFCALN